MKILKEGGHRLFEEDMNTSEYVSKMLNDLEKNEMLAVRRLSKRFDDWDPPNFELSESQIEEAISKCSEVLISDTDYCQDNVRRFSEAQFLTLKPLEIEIRKGVILGHKHIPINCSGCYIPGGIYPMFGSAQMSIIPAKVAGVKNVIACTPPIKGKGYYPATINAIKKAGADRIFVIGGIQAIAMMAFGMGEAPPADILCGAGNKYIAEAKRQLFGRCGIDLLAGPTEIAIIADDEADQEIVACDLLGQAEHDPNSGILLVCESEDFGLKVLDELNKQLEVLPTKDIASLSWGKNGKVYISGSRSETIKICNDYAPEHLELHVTDTSYYFENLTNYGSLFIGEETTVAYGDKTIGTNHILPTSRASRYTGGLWVGKFLKTITYQKMSREASIEVGKITERQCKEENMLAHSLTAEKRIEKYNKI